MALNPVPGTPNDDDLDGTLLGDLVLADAGHDTVHASDGNDTVRGEAGNDFLYGGYGNDRIYGGAGNDVINGEYGDDWLYGGGGNDHIQAGSIYSQDTDHVFGGGGDDLIFFWPRNSGEADGGEGHDRLQLFWYDNFGDGADITVNLTGPGAGASTTQANVTFANIESLIVYTYTGDDTINTGDFADEVFAHQGANTVNTFGGDDVISYVAGEANALDGGGGTDLLRVAPSSFSPLIFTVTGTAATDGYGSTISNMENYIVYGSYYDDQVSLGTNDDEFYGGRGGDYAFGGSGNDRLSGNQGTDMLEGFDGNDILIGGGGDDILTGGAGRDRLAGGNGADRFTFIQSGGHDVVLDFSDGEDLLDVSAFGLTAITQFMSITASGNDVVIQIDLSNSIRLKNYLAGHTIGDISNADFDFV